LVLIGDKYPLTTGSKSPQAAVAIYRRKTVHVSTYRPELIVKRHSPTLIRDLFKNFKRNTLNLKQEPDVTFLGEEGIDAKGLTKELCHMIVKGLRDGNKGYILFEGEADHLLPIHCEEHVQSNLYFYTGQILAYTFLHGHMGFPGLSRALANDIVTGDMNSVIQHLSINDLPDLTIRMAVTEVSRIYYHIYNTHIIKVII
jgi:hypothetical protein